MQHQKNHHFDIALCNGTSVQEIGEVGWDNEKFFLTALDLEPKDNNLIKDAFDRLDEPDIDEEVSTF